MRGRESLARTIRNPSHREDSEADQDAHRRTTDDCVERSVKRVLFAEQEVEGLYVDDDLHSHKRRKGEVKR